MYSLTFRVRVTTPQQYGRNGTASLQVTSRRVNFIAGEGVFAGMRSACGVRVDTRGHPLPLLQVTSGSVQYFRNAAADRHTGRQTRAHTHTDARDHNTFNFLSVCSARENELMPGICHRYVFSFRLSAAFLIKYGYVFIKFGVESIR